ncbi:MAG TPA: ATP-binding cassette domain-containing protein [Clostridiaceae bacterium]
MKIVIKDICHNFGGQQVLRNINFSDEFNSLAVIGPSGAGKSTLLRIIGGLLIPTSGELILEDNNISFREKALQEYRRNLSFVFQSHGLFEHMTACENITLPLIHTFGYNKTDALDSAVKLLSRFGLFQEKDKYPSQLSGGQQQRIAIARAVAAGPKLMLLDEPTSALDPELTSEVLNMLGELQDEGLKTIIVTHEMGFARKACERALFICDNTIIESGSSSELFKAPRSVKLKAFLNKVLEWNA